MENKGDVIYRQDVLKLIQTIPPEESSRQLLHQSVLQMPSAETESKWIPCSDKKHPDEITDCYVTLYNKWLNRYYVSEDIWWKDLDIWDKYEKSEIIAWMPISKPEPYKPEGRIYGRE